MTTTDDQAERTVRSERQLAAPPGRALSAPVVLLLVLILGACADVDPEARLVRQLEQGRAAEVAAALAGWLDQRPAAEPGDRARWRRLRWLALALDQRVDEALDLLAGEAGDHAPQDALCLGRTLLDHPQPERALDLAAAARERWPEHGARWDELSDTARVARMLWLEEEQPHGPIVSESWGYPQGGFCSHTARYADGTVIHTDVPSR